jgi:hypothetical protein
MDKDKANSKQKLLLSNYFLIRFLEIISIKNLQLSFRVLKFFDRIIECGRVQIKTTVFVFTFKKFLGLLLQILSQSRFPKTSNNSKEKQIPLNSKIIEKALRKWLHLTLQRYSLRKKIYSEFKLPPFLVRGSPEMLLRYQKTQQINLDFDYKKETTIYKFSKSLSTSV